MPDLWPAEFGQATATPPVAILREQAEIIGKRTRGFIEGEVRTSRSGLNFLHEFFLVVPTLGNYDYRLLFVTHPLELYPAEFNAEVLEDHKTVCDEGQFTIELQRVLNSEQTKKIVGVLLAQTRGQVA